MLIPLCGETRTIYSDKANPPHPPRESDRFGSNVVCIGKKLYVLPNACHCSCIFHVRHFCFCPVAHPSTFVGVLQLCAPDHRHLRSGCSRLTQLKYLLIFDKYPEQKKWRKFMFDEIGSFVVLSPTTSNMCVASARSTCV